MWEQVKDLKAKLEEYHEQSMSEAAEKAESAKQEVISLMYNIISPLHSSFIGTSTNR